MMEGREGLRQPTNGELAITIQTLDWLTALVEEQDEQEIAEPLRLARAFTAATLHHNQ
jgi:hypothetical protein